MSEKKLYAIEFDGDGGDATTIRRLVQCTCTNGVLNVSRHDITSMHRLVCCKECACMRKNPLVECGCICKVFGFAIPDQDDFCAWGEEREEER